MINRKQIEELVRQKISAVFDTKLYANPPLNFVNEQKLLECSKNATVLISPNAIVTPSAQDVAQQLGVRFEVVATGLHIPNLDNITHNSIAIGSDHAGFSMKESIKSELKGRGHDLFDVGTYSEVSVDYPDFAYPVALLVGSGRCKRGIIVDGAGIGSAIVANKIYGVRAANCNDLFAARNAREHNNSNVLTLGARIIGSALALEIVRVWLETAFAADKHQKRIDKISKIEERELRCHS